MQPASPFSAGPRLTDGPKGDPAAQAVASLRGYAYQLYTSGLAWLALPPGEVLHLEVAKDYAVIAGEALSAVEVKDTAASKVTINSEDVMETLDGFVDLVERNPAKIVRLRFLSTSLIGQEKKKEDRANGEPTLGYWRRAAMSADIPPLRKVLLGANLTQRVRAYINARDDEKLREELLQRIHWDCGSQDLEGVIAELEGGLQRYASERLGAHTAEKSQLSAAVLQKILATVVSPPPRQLVDTDLLSALTAATSVSVSQRDLNILLRSVQALDEATAALGDDPILTRARAKILYRRKDHKAALTLLRDAADKTTLNDPIERTYMLREAGISAAEIGEWAEARQWFADANTVAGKVKIQTMRAIRIGLRADEAVAAYKSGDVKGALIGFDQALEELNGLDSGSTIGAAYCHRVVRHAIMWMFRDATGLDMIVDGQETVIVPGMCSNPEPTDLRDMPLGAAEYVRYFLAQVEIATGVDAEIETNLPKRLQGRALPGMELFLRKAHIDRSLRDFDAASFWRMLPAWADSQSYLSSHKEEFHAQGPESPLYGEIPKSSAEQVKKSPVIFAVEDAILVYGITAAIANRADALKFLYENSNIYDASYPGRQLLEVMTTGKKVNERIEEYTAEQVFKVCTQVDLTPNELFVACVRFTQTTKLSNFKSTSTPVLIEWVSRHSFGITLRHGFRLFWFSLTAEMRKDVSEKGQLFSQWNPNPKR